MGRGHLDVLSTGISKRRLSALVAACTWCLTALLGLRAADPLPAGDSSLTREQAAALVEQTEGPLVLAQLPGIDAEAALELARHGGGLALDGLVQLDAATAQALALHGQIPEDIPADLDVDALLAQVADLAEGADGPDLDGIEQLLAGLGAAEGDGAAAAGDAWLSLGGLRQIDAALAMALAMHEGPLLLDGVTKLSLEAAQALATHVGELSLAGLKAFPEDVRAALAEHDGPVTIPDSLVGK